MKIKFKNGSSIDSIDDASDTKRSQKREEQIVRMTDKFNIGSVIQING